MKRMIKLLGILAVVVLMSASAYATPLQMDISTGAFTLTIDDGDTGAALGHAADSNAAAGAITFIGSLGGWTFQVNTGLGSPAIGMGNMDLAFLANGAAGTADLIIKFSEAGITEAGSFEMTVGGTANGTGTVTYTAYYGAALQTEANLIATLGPFCCGAFSGNGGGGSTPALPFAMTQKIVIEAGANGTTANGDAGLTVPEPSTLLLLGTGLIGLATWRRRRPQ